MSNIQLKQSVDHYFQDRKTLEYLDLAIQPPCSKESIEGLEFSCFTKGYKHTYHSDNRQLNLLCDLQLNTLHNISVIHDHLLLLSKVCLKHLHSLEEKLEVLQKEIFPFEEFQKKIEKLPSKKDLAGLIEIIEPQKGKNIQTLSLEKKFKKIEELVEQLHKQWT